MPRPVVWAENRTGIPLTFDVRRGDTSAFVVGPVVTGQRVGLFDDYELRPNSLLATNGCSKYDIVALDPARREVARHGPGLCAGDMWVVEIGPSAPPS